MASEENEETVERSWLLSVEPQVAFELLLIALLDIYLFAATEVNLFECCDLRSGKFLQELRAGPL